MKKVFLFLVFCLMPLSAWAAPMSFTVNMSEAVNVGTGGGTPRIAVDVGGVTRYASYASGSGGSALTFNYQPQAGDLDLDGIALSSPLDLNGGTIADLNGNAISNLTFTAPNTSGIKIDYPSLSMDFVGSDYILSGTHYGTLPAFLTAAGGTFTRASVGTYFDAAGTLQTATANTPRFDYDPVTHAAKGILIEEQRTNLLKHSDDLTIAGWVIYNSTLTPNAAIAPDGTMSAYKLVENTTANTQHWITGTGFNVVLGQTYILSVYVKAGERTIFNMFGSGIFPQGAAFNLSTGTKIAGTGTITPVGNGWYRCSVVLVANNTGAGAGYIAQLQNGAGSTYTGDAVSGLYLWGPQLEQGAFPTSYIPTTTAAVTRQADSLTMPTGAWFDGNIGTFYAYFDGGRESSQGTYGRVISSSVSYTLLSCDGGSTSRAGTWGGVSPPLQQDSGQDYYIIPGTAAMSYNQTSMTRSLSLRGNAAITGSYLNPYSFGTFGIGRNSGSTTNMLNGHIQKLKYYPSRVADTQLQLLTQ
jgi:hypothetical protein